MQETDETGDANAETKTVQKTGASDGDNPQDTIIIALYRLPIIASKENGEWNFRWDDDALYLTCMGLRIGLQKQKLIWIGVLNVPDEFDADEEARIRETLLDRFNCYPVFVAKKTLYDFYQGFCKGVLWPVFHMVYNVTDDENHTNEFPDQLWSVYCDVNQKFSEAVVKMYKSGNMIWIHDYHLMVLPRQLRMTLSGAHIGFYLHTPWPSSEAYRLLPMRDKILSALLFSSLIGFNLFDYARHFLSACVRILNIQEEAATKSLAVAYGDRHVVIRVSHIGIYPPRFTEAIRTSEVVEIETKLRERYRNKFVLGAIDDLDFIKGIPLKLLAFESHVKALRCTRPEDESAVLYQVAIPRAARVKESAREEIRTIVERVNSLYGTETYKPIEYVESDITFEHRVALYRVFDALLLTPIRDGLNLIPYEYLICTEDIGKGQLVLSEFTGCSRALSSSYRCNPFETETVMKIIDVVRQGVSQESSSRHEADINYVKTHTTVQWAESFINDLKEANEPIRAVTFLGIGVGPGTGLVEFSGYEHLSNAKLSSKYKTSASRLFLLDYDGTLTSTTCSSRMAHAWARPPEAANEILKRLAEDDRNTIYIMSGRKRAILEKSFEGMRSLGIAAEHGFYYRNPYQSDWSEQEKFETIDLSWLNNVLEIMQSYTQRTDGSYIEKKTVGLVWHYLDADPEFGSWQAQEMQKHLERELDTSKIQVIAGQGWLQVRYQHINKGAMVQRVLNEARFRQPPDFVLCIGDDRTDEDMFSYLQESKDLGSSAIYTCTVGIKPSKAKYYLRNSDEVVTVLNELTLNELRPSKSTPENFHVLRRCENFDKIAAQPCIDRTVPSINNSQRVQAPPTFRLSNLVVQCRTTASPTKHAARSGISGVVIVSTSDLESVNIQIGGASSQTFA